VKVILPKGRIAATHGQFNRVRHVAPCTPHPLSNTCFLVTTPVHNPNSISIGSAIFAHLTDPIQWAAPSPSKLPLHIRGSGPPSNTWFLCHRSLSTYQISLKSEKRFLDRLTAGTPPSSSDTKSRTNIKNPSRSNLNIVL